MSHWITNIQAKRKREENKAPPSPEKVNLTAIKNTPIWKRSVFLVTLTSDPGWEPIGLVRHKQWREQIDKKSQRGVLQLQGNEQDPDINWLINNLRAWFSFLAFLPLWVGGGSLASSSRHGVCLGRGRLTREGHSTNGSFWWGVNATQASP